MPQPPKTYLDTSSNCLITEETSYDIEEMTREHQLLLSQCNAQQLEVYNCIMEALTKNDSGLFFVYGSGGCVNLRELKENMRLTKGINDVKTQKMAKFTKWVLNIGDGKIDRAHHGDVEEDIEISEEFCNLGNVNYVDDMIESIFPDLHHNFQNPRYLSERAILTPTNNTVCHINDVIVEKIPG
ncbi:uncharacterized protein LOC141664774 [Apium graveolens]|uniref:uncharacterized protein LOC141664774 n=1 Tax=Apium graveolens TaxID=4045 RepID=UPI003D7A84E5